MIKKCLASKNKERFAEIAVQIYEKRELFVKRLLFFTDNQG